MIQRMFGKKKPVVQEDKAAPEAPSLAHIVTIPDIFYGGREPEIYPARAPEARSAAAPAGPPKTAPAGQAAKAPARKPSALFKNKKMLYIGGGVFFLIAMRDSHTRGQALNQ